MEDLQDCYDLKRIVEGAIEELEFRRDKQGENGLDEEINRCYGLKGEVSQEIERILDSLPPDEYEISYSSFIDAFARYQGIKNRKTAIEKARIMGYLEKFEVLYAQGNREGSSILYLVTKI